MARADGGWDQKDSFKKRPDFINSNNPPSREPDFIDNIETLPQSALLYRLCGDMNPLHADPTVAKEAGFNRPILHGRCTLGIAIRSLVAKCCGYDATKLTELALDFPRLFSRLQMATKIWRERNNLYFESFDFESGTKVLAEWMRNFSRLRDRQLMQPILKGMRIIEASAFIATPILQHHIGSTGHGIT